MELLKDENLENNEEEVINITYEDIIRISSEVDEAGFPRGAVNATIFKYDKEKEAVEVLSEAAVVKGAIHAKLSEYYSCLMIEIVCKDYDEQIALEEVCEEWAELVKKQQVEDKFLSVQLLPMEMGGLVSVICNSVDFFISHKESKILFVCDREGIRIQNVNLKKLADSLGLESQEELEEFLLRK